MKRRFRRRDLDENRPPSLLERIPGGVIWTILAVLVLLLVLGYDRVEQKQAKDHAAIAKGFEDKGEYTRAISEYDRALANSRLSRKVKADIAIHVAGLYMDHFEDYDRATKYFTDARHFSPKSVEGQEVAKRMELARERSTGAAPGNISEEAPIERVELIRPPGEDATGPVVARFRGEAIHLGEIDREIADSVLSGTIQKLKSVSELEAEVSEYLDKALVYRAAIDAGVNRNPDVTRRLFDYQRDLISQRYLENLRRESQVVTNDDVKKYYESHHEQYARPAQLGLALIKLPTREAADGVLEKLRKGTSFGDLATSESIETTTSKTRGVAGFIYENNPVIPGLGTAPEIYKSLMEMPLEAVSKVIPVNNAFFIFKVLNRIPARDISFEEARMEIERTLRSRLADKTHSKLYENLHTQYEAKVDRDAIANIFKTTHPAPERPTTETLEPPPTPAADQPPSIHIGAGKAE